MRVAITGDHNAVDLKARLAAALQAAGHDVTDLGVGPGAGTVDYPPLCAALGRRVAAGDADFGIVVGGSGSGEAIACNKIRGVRAALCHDEFVTEIARAHNLANVMVVGAKVIAPDLALRLLEVWLRTPFKGGVHQDRVDQITALERADDLDKP